MFLRISKIEIFPTRVPYRHLEVSSLIRRGGVTDTIVKVTSDDGLVGWGECTRAADATGIVSAVKAMVPEKVCKIIDDAIQIHGATGISQWTPLANLYTDMRHLRFADGPDEVHHMVVGRNEIRQHGLW